MKKLNFAIIGTGNMANIYAQILKNNISADIVAVCGNTKNKTKLFAKNFSCKYYSNANIDAMIREQNEIDAVIITTPEWVRETIIRKFLERKIHILCEKPMAASLSEGKRIYNLLKNYPKYFIVAHSLRFNPNFFVIKEKLEQKKIGDLKLILSRRNANKELVKRVRGKFELSFWLSPHEIDVITWFSNSKIKKVFAKGSQSKKSSDFISCLFTLEDGTHAHHLVNWSNDPISSTSNQSSFEIYGSKGVIAINDNPNNIILYKDNNYVEGLDTNYSTKYKENNYGYFNNLVSYFINVIIKNKKPIFTIKDSLDVLTVCDAISRSIKTSKEIEIKYL